MRKIDESERPMPEIDLAKACFIIEKSREYLGEDAGVEADDSNPADDDEQIMLTDTAGRSIRRELIEFIKDLDMDEAAALVALSWIGGATFSRRSGKSPSRRPRSGPRARPGNTSSRWSCCPTTSRTRSPPLDAPARLRVRRRG